ncbi:MAG: hypothetical protein NWE90_07370 [Candidatus Bathyarchaeota archaeon]|nr:hypothetical protein [Candidatus Bathyarchaeota archaeon]
MNITPSEEYDFSGVPTKALIMLEESAVNDWRELLEEILNKTQALHALHYSLNEREELEKEGDYFSGR